MTAARRELRKILKLVELGRDADAEALRHLDRLEHLISGQCCEHACAAEPANIHLTASDTPGGHPVSSYPAGAPVYLTANVTNAEGVSLADQVAWTASAGTVTADPANPLWATLANAPLGDATVTAVASNGIEATDTVTIVDNTPAAISLTDSATPNTPAA